ncbi:MAG: DUF1302 family protein [Porticoccaceae bacterium]|nr:DUF1302 family protein [Porticoccaceae bacterium]
MTIKSIKPIQLISSTLALSLFASASASQAFNLKVAGFIRQEMSYSIGSKNNPWQRGSPDIYDGGVGTLQNTASGDPRAEAVWDGLRAQTAAALGAPPPVDTNLPTSFLKPNLDKDNDWNLMATRAEIDFHMNFNDNWSGFVKLRGYYLSDVQNTYTVPSSFEDGGDDNNFKVDLHGKCASVLEVCDDNFMIDLPSAYLDYQNGSFWMRIGNQQIAWGESIFFRVMDVPNGLDLRRHSFLDTATEEYADERIPSPAIRVSYNLNNDWEIEAYAQMFQPTVHPRVGSSYAFVNSPYVIRNDIGFDKVDDQINVGMRLKGQIGDLGLTFIAVSRHNPDPIFQWGPSNQTSMDAVFPGFSSQPFKVNSLTSLENLGLLPGGGDFPAVGGKEGPRNGTINSSDWMMGAALSGLDGVETLNVLANDFAFVGGFFQQAFIPAGMMPNADVANGIYVTNAEEAKLNIDTFLSLLGDVGADFIPNYASENVFGFGLNYIFFAEPDSWLDQLIVRFEATYTPDRKWTNNGARKPITEDEWITGFAVEKYHRISSKFPATFFSFQWMHKSESDFVGRHLSTLGGTLNKGPSGGESHGGWDAIAFAFQQPSPGLKWRYDFSFLYDFNGSWLLQPGIRYKPKGDWTIEAFATWMDSSDTGAALTPIDWTDEVTVRLTYQF